MEMSVLAEDAPLVIGATGLAAIAQNVRMILATMANTVPLDRAFCRTGHAVDSPMPAAMARERAEVVEVIERHEPRVKVTAVEFTTDRTTTRLVARVRFRVLEDA